MAVFTSVPCTGVSGAKAALLQMQFKAVVWIVIVLFELYAPPNNIL